MTAHRGLSSQAPENTLAAFRRAVDAGTDMLELDVHLTADDRVAVIHDRTLQRTTTGNGAVRSYTSREISELDAGSWFDPEFSAERVPMLETVLALAFGRCWLNVELKSHAFHRERPGVLERRVLDAVRNGGMLDRTIFTSFDHRLVRGIRDVEPSAVTGILYNWHTNLFRSPSVIASRCGASVFICSSSQLSPAFLRDARVAGLAVSVYTVNDPQEALRLADRGVDGIISDAADVVRAALVAR